MVLQGLEYKIYRSRIHWIDVARCINIAIIVYAHIYNASRISAFVHVFHVPVFFVLSGLVWKPAESKRQLLHNLFIQLIVPYFAAGLVHIAAYQIMGARFSGKHLEWSQCLEGLLYANSRTGLMKWNRPLWFLPCLTVTRLMWEGISRLKREWARHAVVLLIALAGACTVCSDAAGVKLPWEAEVAVHALFYFSIGVALHRHTPICSANFSPKKARLWPVIGVSFGLCLLVFRCNRPPISFQYNQYGVYPLFVLGALSGTALVFGISLAISKNRSLEIVGQNSLGILLWHKFPILLFQVTPLGKQCLSAPDSPKSILLGLLVLLISIAASLSVGWMFRKSFERFRCAPDRRVAEQKPSSGETQPCFANRTAAGSSEPTTQDVK